MRATLSLTSSASRPDELMADVIARLAELGYALPELVPPLAAYVPAVRTGNLVFTAGQLPLVAGKLWSQGLVADDPGEKGLDSWVIDSGFVDVQSAKECAARCALNAIAAIGSVADLDRVTRIIKVTGYVAGTEGFRSHPQVVNGASELLGLVWGDSGRHARSAVGVANLPLGAPVEIELIAEVWD